MDGAFHDWDLVLATYQEKSLLELVHQRLEGKGKVFHLSCLHVKLLYVEEKCRVLCQPEQVSF